MRRVVRPHEGTQHLWFGNGLGFSSWTSRGDGSEIQEAEVYSNFNDVRESVSHFVRFILTLQLPSEVQLVPGVQSGPAGPGGGQSFHPALLVLDGALTSSS